MAKRKPSPKATYVYVKDETAPAGSKKRGVTGGIKKEKTSPERGPKMRDTVRSRDSGGKRDSDDREIKSNKADAAEVAKKIGARNRTAADKELGIARNARGDVRPYRKRGVDDQEDITLVSNPTYKGGRDVVTKVPKRGFSSRTEELEASVSELPKGGRPERKMGPLIPVRADKAAGPATVPSSGTGAGSAPAKPDRGAEFGGAITVGKGIGAPDAISGTYKGGKSVKVDKVTKEKRYKGVTYSTKGKSGGLGGEDGKTVHTSEVVITKRKGGHAYQSDVETTDTDVRQMRSPESIAETRRRAGGRIQGGLKTTEYRPMDVAGPSTSGDRRKRRAEKKLQRRIAKGKVKMPERIGMGAVAAAVSATEVAAGKNKTATPTVSGSDVSAYMYSHEALAHELAGTHFKGHTASEIMDYVKHTGSSMPEFHKHVANAHEAETKTIPVGPPTDTRKRSAGKITRWRVSKKTGELESVSSYRGWHQTHGRDEQDRNVKVWKKFKAPSKKGSMSHIEYLHGQITKHKEMRAMEAKDTRERNRTRGVSSATSAITGAMATTPVKKDPSRPPKGKSGKVKVTRPRPEGMQGPELSTGTFSERIENPSEGKFTEVKKPRKRNLNY